MRLFCLLSFRLCLLNHSTVRPPPSFSASSVNLFVLPSSPLANRKPSVRRAKCLITPFSLFLWAYLSSIFSSLNFPDILPFDCINLSSNISEIKLPSFLRNSCLHELHFFERNFIYVMRLIIWISTNLLPFELSFNVIPFVLYIIRNVEDLKLVRGEISRKMLKI